MGRKYSGIGGICRRVERRVVSPLVLFVWVGIKGRGICVVLEWVVGVDG